MSLSLSFSLALTGIGNSSLSLFLFLSLSVVHISLSLSLSLSVIPPLLTHSTLCMPFPSIYVLFLTLSLSLFVFLSYSIHQSLCVSSSYFLGIFSYSICRTRNSTLSFLFVCFTTPCSPGLSFSLSFSLVRAFSSVTIKRTAARRVHIV